MSYIIYDLDLQAKCNILVESLTLKYQKLQQLKLGQLDLSILAKGEDNFDLAALAELQNIEPKLKALQTEVNSLEGEAKIKAEAQLDDLQTRAQTQLRGLVGNQDILNSMLRYKPIIDQDLQTLRLELVKNQLELCETIMLGLNQEGRLQATTSLKYNARDEQSRLDLIQSYTLESENFVDLGLKELWSRLALLIRSPLNV